MSANAKQALFNYLQRTMPDTGCRKAKPKTSNNAKRNKKPEATFLLALKKHIHNTTRWQLHIIEAKSTYSEQAGRYLASHAPTGYPDLSGNTADGQAVFIEVKAPGKLKTLRPEQHEFLKEKILQNCFAIVTDSIDRFDHIRRQYTLTESRLKQRFLLDQLPELAPRYKDDFDL